MHKRSSEESTIWSFTYIKVVSYSSLRSILKIQLHFVFSEIIPQTILCCYFQGTLQYFIWYFQNTSSWYSAHHCSLQCSGCHNISNVIWYTAYTHATGNVLHEQRDTVNHLSSTALGFSVTTRQFLTNHNQNGIQLGLQNMQMINASMCQVNLCLSC